MDLFNLSGVISLNADKFNKQAEEADKKGKKLGERLKDITDTAAGRLLSRGIEELGSAIYGLSKKAIKLAGDLEQGVGGAMAVFGEDKFWAIERAGQKAFKTMGLSYADFLNEVNKMGSLMQGSGVSIEDSLDWSVKWMERASDVASIMGRDVGDAMQAIEGAAKGNYTMMDNLGVKMDNTTLEAYRLAKGIQTPFNKMKESEKVRLAYEYFMEKTAKYAGNYAAENDTLAGSLTTLNAAWENLLAGVGDGTEVWESAEVALGQIWKTAQKVLPKIWNSMRNALKKNWPKIADQMGQFLRNLPQTLTDVAVKGANGLIDIINSTFGSNIPHIKDIKLPTWEEIKTGAITALNKVIGNINSWFGTKIPEIKDIHIPTWEEIKKTGETALNKVIEGINGFFGLNLPKLGTPEFPDFSTIIQAATDWWNDNQIGQGITGIANWVLGWFDGTPGSEMDAETKTILTNWWNGISGAVTDACNWVLGWFSDGPEGTFEGSSAQTVLAQWWKGIKGAVSSACNWVLGWFTTPEGTFEGSPAQQTLSTWWNGISGAITSACNWVLGWFNGTPGNTLSSETKTLLTSWWSNIGPTIANACGWTLKLFNFPKESVDDIKALFTTWWNARFGGLGDLAVWTLSLPNFPDPNTAGLALNKILTKWWGDVQAAMQQGINFTLKLFGIEPKDASGAVTGADLNSWFDEKVKPKLDMVGEFVLGVMGYENVNQLLADLRFGLNSMLLDLAEAFHFDDLFGMNIEKMRSDALLRRDVAFGVPEAVEYAQGRRDEATNAMTDAFSNYTQAVSDAFNSLDESIDRSILNENEIGERTFADFFNPETGLYDFSKATAQELADAMQFTDFPAFNDIDLTGLQEAYASYMQAVQDYQDSLGFLGAEAEITADTKPAETAVAGLVKDINGTSATMTVYTNFVGGVKDGEDDGEESHGNNAKGLDYVPNNGYISELHKGEAILSGNEARAWRENGGRGQNYGGAGEVVAAIQSLGNDISNMRMFVGERAFGGVVVDYGGRGMNNYLGASSKRRRRGYGRT